MKKKKGSLSNVEFILMLVVALLFVNECFEARVIDRVDDGEWQCFNWTEQTDDQYQYRLFTIPPDFIICSQIHKVVYRNNSQTFACDADGIHLVLSNLTDNSVVYIYDELGTTSYTIHKESSRTCNLEAFVRPPK